MRSGDCLRRERDELGRDRAAVARVTVDDEVEGARGVGQHDLAAAAVATADADTVADARGGGQAAHDRLMVAAARRHPDLAGSHLGSDVGGGLEDDGETVVTHVLHVGTEGERHRLGARRAACPKADRDGEHGHARAPPVGAPAPRACSRSA